MRKLFLGLGLSLTALLVLTGCGEEKTLECNISETEEGMEVSQKVLVKFKGNKVDGMDMIHDIKVPDEMKSLVSTLESTMNEQFKNQKEFKDAKVETSSKDNTITVKVSMDAKTIADASDGIIDYKGNYDDIKAELEKEGYECK